MFSIQLLIGSCLLQLAWARTLSVALNLTLEPEQLSEMLRDPSGASSPPSKSQQLTAIMLNSCLRETELSVTQLKLFRLTLLSSYDGNVKSFDDDVDGTQLPEMDAGNSQQMPMFELKRNEPLQCFVRCLYEHLGLIRYDLLLEDVYKTQIKDIIQRERPDMKECLNFESKNRCEAAFKLNLCYNHLKALEAAERIREIIENGEADERIREDIEKEEAEVRNRLSKYDEKEANDADSGDDGFHIEGLKASAENKV